MSALKGNEEITFSNKRVEIVVATVLFIILAFVSINNIKNKMRSKSFLTSNPSNPIIFKNVETTKNKIDE